MRTGFNGNPKPGARAFLVLALAAGITGIATTPAQAAREIPAPGGVLDVEVAGDTVVWVEDVKGGLELRSVTGDGPVRTLDRFAPKRAHSLSAEIALSETYVAWNPEDREDQGGDVGFVSTGWSLRGGPVGGPLTDVARQTPSQADAPDLEGLTGTSLLLLQPDNARQVVDVVTKATREVGPSKAPGTLGAVGGSWLALAGGDMVSVSPLSGGAPAFSVKEDFANALAVADDGTVAWIPSTDGRGPLQIGAPGTTAPRTLVESVSSHGTDEAGGAPVAIGGGRILAREAGGLSTPILVNIASGQVQRLPTVPTAAVPTADWDGRRLVEVVRGCTEEFIDIRTPAEARPHEAEAACAPEAITTNSRKSISVEVSCITDALPSSCKGEVTVRSKKKYRVKGHKKPVVLRFGPVAYSVGKKGKGTTTVRLPIPKNLRQTLDGLATRKRRPLDAIATELVVTQKGGPELRIRDELSTRGVNVQGCAI